MKSEDFYDGVDVRDLYANISRAFDQSPKEIEFLNNLVLNKIKEVPKEIDIDQEDFFNRVYHPCVYEIKSSEKALGCIELIIDRYDKLPTTETIRLAKDGHNSIAKAVLLGLVIGAVVVGIYIIYKSKKHKEKHSCRQQQGFASAEATKKSSS